MVVAGFPYCQSAYILMAKQAAETGSMLADQKLKKAAAYTLDRKNLKHLLSGKKSLLPVPLEQTPLEIVPVEKMPLEVLPVRTETILPEIIEEKNVSETKAELPEEKPAIKEALSDQQRDQIIEELKENLKKLHDRKIKAAWEDLPEETILANNEVKTESVESVTIETPESIVPVVSENKVLPKEEDIENPTEQPVVISEMPGALNFNTYFTPIRTEDVVVELKETEADPDLLLEYLDFLEEKRGVFRKNKKKENAIIDKIIKEDPTIPKLDINNLPDNSVDLSSKSSTISKEPVSENFAKILALQGKKDKAIEIYEQLILKNPEKKPYFEALIEKLKNKI